MFCILVQDIIFNIHISKAIVIWPIIIIACSTFGTSNNISIVYKPCFSQPCESSKRCPQHLLKIDFPCHLLLSTSICFYQLLTPINLNKIKIHGCYTYNPKIKFLFSIKNVSLTQITYKQINSLLYTSGNNLKIDEQIILAHIFCNVDGFIMI